MPFLPLTFHPMIETRHLRTLRAVAESGSFAAAARQLGCTQPAVSQQMKALELAMGTPLLILTGREIRLTEAGAALVRHSVGVLTGLHAAEEEMAAFAGLRAGRVRLTSFLSGTSALIPSALAAMRAAHPGIEVSLSSSPPPRSIDLLRSADCDISLAFRYSEIPGAGTKTQAEWQDLVVRPLLADPLVVLVPDTHRLAEAEQVELAQLADESWVMGCSRCHSHLLRLCGQAGFEPRAEYRTDDYQTVIGLVAAGLGVAVLPELALSGPLTRGIRLLRLEPVVHREVVALSMPGFPSVPAVGLMLRELERSATRLAGSSPVRPGRR